MAETFDDELNWLEEVKEDADFITKQRLAADLRKRGAEKKTAANRAAVADEAEVVVPGTVKEPDTKAKTKN